MDELHPAKMKLNALQIKTLVAAVPKWQFVPAITDNACDKLTRKYQFRSFEESWCFLTRVAMKSHKLGHHPLIKNLYNVVELELTTHDVQGLSELDFKMAKSIEKAANQLGVKD